MLLMPLAFTFRIFPVITFSLTLILKTIGGSRNYVFVDLQMMEDETATLGLKLNRSKTDLVSSDVDTQDTILCIVSELKVVLCSQVSLLVTPIGSPKPLDSTIEAKSQRLHVMGMMLSDLRSQDALCHLVAIPKVFFILQSAPCILSNQLELFDGLLRSLLLSILNIDPNRDASWLQATQPVCTGGLVVCRAAQLSPFALLPLLLTAHH